MAHDGVGLQMCYRRVCGSTPGDWDSNNPVLAVSLRRCRTTAYTSSAVPRFTNMLLSPRPFGSRSVVRLGVIDPELRPPQVAIPSVRDTAHTFASSGSPEKEMSCDSTGPFPYGAPVASRAKPSSLPPGATGAVSSFLLPLLAVLHHGQDIPSWHLAPTLPPPSFPYAGIFTSSSEVRW